MQSNYQFLLSLCYPYPELFLQYIASESNVMKIQQDDQSSFSNSSLSLLSEIKSFPESKKNESLNQIQLEVLSQSNEVQICQIVEKESKRNHFYFSLKKQFSEKQSQISIWREKNNQLRYQQSFLSLKKENQQLKQKYKSLERYIWRLEQENFYLKKKVNKLNQQFDLSISDDLQFRNQRNNLQQNYKVQSQSSYLAAFINQSSQFQ